MFEFDQYLGFLAIIVVLIIGFWVMFFLVSLIPYWIGGVFYEKWKMKRDAKKAHKEI